MALSHHSGGDRRYTRVYMMALQLEPLDLSRALKDHGVRPDCPLAQAVAQNLADA